MRRGSVFYVSTLFFFKHPVNTVLSEGLQMREKFKYFSKTCY